MPFPDNFSRRAADVFLLRAHFDPPQLAEARELIARLSVLIDNIEAECHGGDCFQDAQCQLTQALDSIEAGVRVERRYREDQR